MSQLPIEQAFQNALQYHQAGQLPQAENLYKQILSQRPRHVGALQYLGVIAHQVGRNDIAVDLLRQALALQPSNAEACNNLGLILGKIGQLDEAIAVCRQALSLKPNFPEAYNNLGNALREKGQLDEAIAVYRQAIALRLDYPEVYSNLGTAMRDKGQPDEAVAAYRHAITLKPNYAEAYNNLGSALKDQGQLDEAVAAYRQAIAFKPDYADAFSNLGSVLKDKRHLDDAIAACRQALILDSNLAEAHSNLGSALNEKGQLDEAVAAYRQAIVLKPNLAEAYSNLGGTLKDQGQLGDAIAAFRQAIALKPDYLEAHSNLVYTIHFHPGYDARTIAEEHRGWSRQHAEPLRRFVRSHDNDRNPDRRLRIGYVSPDLRQHPIGRFLLPLLAHHDKNSVEVFAYSQSNVVDEVTEKLRSRTDSWRSIVGVSDGPAADLIRQDQIDILVDLTMHMANNRLLIFARKPSPVQVTYLAYCSTTGLETIDYRLSDPYLDPSGMDESVYSEQTIRLPETYWCYQPTIAIPEVSTLPALQRGFIAFASQNNFCKVSEPALAVWAALLRAVPKSQILLSASEGSHRQRILNCLELEGIEPRRVQFAGIMPTEKYFELYGQIDIALDPFPYGGGTTTCDALWMGVPVVSLSGKTGVGRGGLSILSNVGLPELVAHSEEEYLRIATELAADLPRLSSLRSILRQQMRGSALTDAPRFARSVEAAYRQMWLTWCRSGG